MGNSRTIKYKYNARFRTCFFIAEYALFLPEPLTADEIQSSVQAYKQEQRAQYIQRNMDKYARLARYSTEPENREKYRARLEQWKDKLNEVNNSFVAKTGQNVSPIRQKMRDNAAADRQQYEKYISILGKENMVGTFDKFQELKYNDNEKWELLKLAYQDKKLQQKIRSEYNLIIFEGRQGKHILGHNNYTEGRSYLTVSMEEAQELVNKYAGTGKIDRDRAGRWTNKELFEIDRQIGIVKNSRGEDFETKRFTIHYSKDKGTHIVPGARM